MTGVEGQRDQPRLTARICPAQALDSGRGSPGDEPCAGRRWKHASSGVGQDRVVHFFTARDRPWSTMDSTERMVWRAAIGRWEKTAKRLPELQVTRAWCRIEISA
jgi:hypothetical protein